MPPSIPQPYYFDAAEWSPASPQYEGAEFPSCEEVKELLKAMAVPALVAKERIVKAAMPGDNADFAPAIYLYRNGRPVITALCYRVGRDDLLEFVSMGVPLFQADAIAIASDMRFPNAQVNPITGDSWLPDEMNELAQQPQYQDCGLWTEAIVVQRIERSGVSTVATFPYTLRPTKWVRPKATAGSKKPNRKKKANKRTLRPGTVLWSGTTTYDIRIPGVCEDVGGRFYDLVENAFAAQEHFSEELNEFASNFSGDEDEMGTRFDIVAAQRLLAYSPHAWELYVHGYNDHLQEAVGL